MGSRSDHRLPANHVELDQKRISPLLWCKCKCHHSYGVCARKPGPSQHIQGVTLRQGWSDRYSKRDKVLSIHKYFVLCIDATVMELIIKQNEGRIRCSNFKIGTTRLSKLNQTHLSTTVIQLLINKIIFLQVRDQTSYKSFKSSISKNLFTTCNVKYCKSLSLRTNCLKKMSNQIRGSL